MKPRSLLLYTLILILILILVLTYTMGFSKCETFTNDIEFHNWWGEPDTDIKHIFNELCKNVHCETIRIYSVFGEPITEKNKNVLTIQYSGESFYNNPELFDINFIPTDSKEDSIIIFPLAYLYLLLCKTDLTALCNRRSYGSPKSSFCLFVVSNGACETRNKMFDELSKYKKVDSCGNHMRNMTCPEGHGSREYLDFIANYKFMICFENTSQPNYLTEKLINAYTSGTIPIYWGCPNISEYVNMDAILYLPPNYTEEDMKSLIRVIEYLDNNADAYQKKYESIFFKDGKIPDEFNLQKIGEKVKRIANKKKDATV